MTHQIYKSCFDPGKDIEQLVLRDGRIIGKEESASSMVERIVSKLFSLELRWSSRDDALQFARSIGTLMDEGRIVFSTPIMTNAGRTNSDKPMSACTVPLLSLLHSDYSTIKQTVDWHHQSAMGTGFNFDEVSDPVSTLLMLNDIAVKGSLSGAEDRPVGNMGICSVDHPRIIDFIACKQARRDMVWKFNISVNTPESFWLAVQDDALWQLKNGDNVYAQEILKLIAQSAHACADPGIVFMDRVNRDNPVPVAGHYYGVAPCAEVGLVKGEICQFGYINIGKFCQHNKIDIDGLERATALMTRALDDCLDASIDALRDEVSKNLMRQRRKIGIGICGLADTLISLGVPYASEEARHIAKDIVAYINYVSKTASHDLAQTRGSFGAMNTRFGCRYNEDPDYLHVRYGSIDTAWVSGEQWKALGRQIRQTCLLRNSSTIALPPTGRSALVIGASTGIEPLFSHTGLNDKPLPVVTSFLEHHKEQRQGAPCADEILKTCTQIDADDHLMMLSALQEVVDESVSKTINLPASVNIADVERILTKGYALNIKGITLYRDGSSLFQPRSIS